jgi:hypothetical protein
MAPFIPRGEEWRMENSHSKPGSYVAHDLVYNIDLSKKILAGDSCNFFGREASVARFPKVLTRQRQPG